MSISHFVVLLCLLMVMSYSLASLVHRTDGAQHVPKAGARSCFVDCNVYKNKNTGKKVCTGCKGDGRIELEYVGPKCPTLDEVQHLFPDDQAAIISKVTDFCTVALNCQCSKVTNRNSDIIVDAL